MSTEWLCLIPARANSKRLPGKNTMLLNHKPLISYTIEAALQCKVPMDVVVSTENEDIARCATASGAMVPFIRPTELAKDDTKVIDVAMHALDTMRQLGKTYQYIAICLPTAPLRQANDLYEAIQIFRSHQMNLLHSVTRHVYPPLRSVLSVDGTMMTPLDADAIKKRAQELQPAFRINGAISLMDVQWFYQSRSYHEYPCGMYIMPEERSVDIDEWSDFLYASYLMQSQPLNT